MKKLYAILISFMVVCMNGCGNSNPVKHIDSCDLIYVTNGNTGNLFFISPDGVNAKLGSVIGDETHSANTKKEDLFSYIKNVVNDLEFKSVDLEESTGWSYRITFMDKDKEIQSITFKGDKTCYINNSDYEITKNSEELEKLFECFAEIEINE